jgi:hypothetical protein
MKTPPDIQVSSILYFLGQALRSDPEIQKWTEAAPEEIVAQTVEYQPLERGPGGAISLMVTQLPALCLHIISEKPKPVPGTIPPTGRQFRAWLWYLFRPFQSDGMETHGFTKGSRLCTLIWWRINYWLKKQKLYTTAAGADGPTFDLQAVSKIRLLEIDGESDRVEFDKVEGIKIPLKVWHGNAPYEEIDPTTLELITLGITSEEGSGVGVSANVDV